MVAVDAVLYGNPSFNDALAYIFRGCVGSLGHYMVRISNFMVFILSDVIMFFFMSMCAVIYLKMENGKTLQNTYEYASDGVVPQIDNLQAVPIDVISVWMESFEKDEVYFISNIEQENGFESYGMLQKQDVDRLLAVPLKREK